MKKKRDKMRVSLLVGLGIFIIGSVITLGGSYLSTVTTGQTGFMSWEYIGPALGRLFVASVLGIGVTFGALYFVNTITKG